MKDLIEKEQKTEKIISSTEKELSKSIVEIMKEIRQQIKEEIATKLISPIVKDKDFLKSSCEDFEKEQAKKAGALKDSVDLRYLNFNYSHTFSLNQESLKSHRSGILGKLVEKIKTTIITWVIKAFESYFNDQVRFKIHMVRYLNHIATYVDNRDSEIFWDLINKFDAEVAKFTQLVERANLEIEGQNFTSHKMFFTKSEEIDFKIKEFSNKIENLENIINGLERTLSLISNKNTAHAIEKVSQFDFNLVDANLAEKSDLNYLLFENRFRGSEEIVYKKMQDYAAMFTKEQRVLEIGCGRGELLKILQAKEIVAEGLDLDSGMIAHCQREGLNVYQENMFDFFQKEHIKKYDVIIAIQVLEHLSFRQIQLFFAESKKILNKGGLIIAETINPSSLVALSNNYYRDPSHISPLHPDTLSFFANLSGLKVVEIQPKSYVEKQFQLSKIELDEYHSLKWQELVAKYNSNIDQLNSLLYGYQDYAIICQYE